MTEIDVELIRRERACGCGCGEPVRPGNRFIHGHHRRGTGNVWYRDTESHRWYVRTRDGGNYYWYRIVMWNELGRELRPDEQVHHINGDREDDRPENLTVLGGAEHLALHSAQGDFARAAAKTNAIRAMKAVGRMKEAA